MIENHSNDCYLLNKRNSPDIINNTNEIRSFYKIINEYLEKINFFNKKDIKEYIFNLYNSNKYSFKFDNNDANNLINNFKKNSVKFNKKYMFINNKDKNNNYILREYSYTLTNIKSNKPNKDLEYAIWSNDFLIAHMRESLYYFIDGTWYKPPGMEQILVFMFYDIISKIKIPGLFAVTNCKIEEIYMKVLKSVYNILTYNEKYELKVKFITTDTELALVNSVKKIFKNAKRIGCYFHYKYDMRNQLNKMKFYTKDKKNETSKVLYELGMIPLLYGGNIDKFQELINNIIDIHPDYENFINERLYL